MQNLFFLKQRIRQLLPMHEGAPTILFLSTKGVKQLALTFPAERERRSNSNLTRSCPYSFYGRKPILISSLVNRKHASRRTNIVTRTILTYPDVESTCRQSHEHMCRHAPDNSARRIKPQLVSRGADEQQQSHSHTFLYLPFAADLLLISQWRRVTLT